MSPTIQGPDQMISYKCAPCTPEHQNTRIPYYLNHSVHSALTTSLDPVLQIQKKRTQPTANKTRINALCFFLRDAGRRCCSSRLERVAGGLDEAVHRQGRGSDNPDGPKMDTRSRWLQPQIQCVDMSMCRCVDRSVLKDKVEQLRRRFWFFWWWAASPCPSNWRQTKARHKS